MVSKALGQLHSKGEQSIALPPHQHVHKSPMVHLSKHNFVNLCFICLCFLSPVQIIKCLHSRYPRKAPKLSTLTGTLHIPLSVFLLHRQQQCTKAHPKADFPADELCAIYILTSWFAREFARPYSNSLSCSNCIFGLASYD